MKLQELIKRLSIQRKEDFPFPDDLDAYLEDFVPNELLKSETLQKAFGVSAYEMEELYREGHRYYEDEQYQDSATIFRWLVLLNPFISKYWMGLAANQQLLEQHEKALHAYAVVALLDSNNPYPHFHAYECYRMLNDIDEANKALDLAYQRTLGNATHKDLRAEIKSKIDGGSQCHSISK